MYMIVALVYVVLLGQPASEPVRFLHRDSFSGLAACQAYLVSDKFQQEEASLRAQALLGAVAAQSRDNAAAGDDEKSVVVPDVSITVSCVEDNRL